METAYQVRKVGDGWGHAIASLDDGVREFKDRVNNISGPYSLRLPPDWAWGPERNLTDTMERVRQVIKAGEAGTRLIVRGENHDGRHYEMRKTVTLEGPQVIEEAKELLGLRYVFGGEVDANGGTDCSGLTLFCYEKGAGVVLPHAASAQMQDAEVRLFTERGKLKTGDLLFWWFPNDRGIPSNLASHVGLFLHGDYTIDTRSTSEPVAIRAIESAGGWASIIAFGRVVSVNGALA